MRIVYLVLGYGVPDDVFTNANVRVYLTIVFNRVFADTVIGPPWPDVTIVISGGPTDCRPPYQRTEAHELARFFGHLRGQRGAGWATKLWTVLEEPFALSALESLIDFKRRCEVTHPDRGVVFCEATRAKRMARLVRSLFGADASAVETVGIDFDTSANRYTDSATIAARERSGLSLDLWALKSEANLEALRALGQERLAYLRAAGPERHVRAVAQWQKREPARRKKLGIPL